MVTHGGPGNKNESTIPYSTSGFSHSTATTIEGCLSDFDAAISQQNTPFTVGTGKAYATIGSAITAAVAAGGTQVVIVFPGTYTETVTMAKDVYVVSSDPFAPRGHTIAGKVTIDIGTVGGAVTNHRTGIAGFIISGAGTDYSVDFTGSYGQEAWIRNCDVYLGTGTAKGLRHNNAAVDPSAATSLLHFENGHIWAAGTNSNTPVEHSAGRLEMVGKIEVDAYSPAVTAMAFSGTSVAWARAGEVVVTGTVAHTSSGALSFPFVSTTTLSTAGMTANGAGTFAVGVCTCLAASGSTGSAVTGAGVFAHSPSTFFFPGYLSSIAATVNGGAGADAGAVASRYNTATLTMTNKTLTQPTLTLKQGASVAPTTEGDIQWDTDDDVLKIGDGTGTKTITPDLLTTKGDLLTRSSTGNTRLSVGGTNGHVLMVDSSAATGLKWDSVPAPTSMAAEDVTYVNTTSGLTATDVQAAIDELVLRTDAATQVLAASDDIHAANEILLVGGSGGAVTLTSTPTIPITGRVKQITIVGTSDTNTVTIQDEATLSGSKLKLANGVSMILGLNDTITFILVGGYWLEISRTDLA